MFRYVVLGTILLLVWLFVVPKEMTIPLWVTSLYEKGEAWLIEVGTLADSNTIEDENSATATVAYVIDGDTIELTTGERVRLLGIDTPEREECYYLEARTYLEEAVAGKDVRLEADVTDTDDYGRLLRHVFLPGSEGERHLNDELVRNGYAVVLPIPPDRAYREELRVAEGEAEAFARGRHSACAS